MTNMFLDMIIQKKEKLVSPRYPKSPCTYSLMI